MYKFFECWLARKFYLGSVGIKSPAISCWGGSAKQLSVVRDLHLLLTAPCQSCLLLDKRRNAFLTCTTFWWKREGCLLLSPVGLGCAQSQALQGTRRGSPPFTFPQLSRAPKVGLSDTGSASPLSFSSVLDVTYS